MFFAKNIKNYARIVYFVKKSMVLLWNAQELTKKEIAMIRQTMAINENIL